MGRCLTATPTPSSPTSIRPSARRSGSRPARCASWPARGVARPGSSRDGSPTRSPRAWSGHATCWSSRSPTRPPARCARRLAALGQPGRGGLDVPCRGAPPAPPFLAARPRQRPAVDPRIEGADPRAAGGRACPAATATSGPRPRRRDRVGEGAPDPPERVRDAGHRRGPRRLVAARPDGGPLPPLRDRQGAGRPDRLRGHARADDRADRGRRRRSRPRSATAIAGSRSTNTRTPTRSRRRSSTRGSAAARTWRSSATRTRRSTRSPAPRATT